MKDNQGYIILRNVRCSFPNLWKNDERNGTTFSKGVKLLLSPTEYPTLATRIWGATEEAFFAQAALPALLLLLAAGLPMAFILSRDSR